MDSTPNPNPNPNHNLSIKAASARKLPIKRKNLDSNPNSSPIPYSTGDDDDFDAVKPPPFKFHRIWTEPDEIRYLQGLLACSTETMSFPKDLNVFYARFSNNMSQPYTKSQLSEKLRRLRKKFRVISSRLAKGLDKALLSPHDRALYELSEQLWHPDYLKTSPFGVCKAKKNVSNGVDDYDLCDVNLSEVKVEFDDNVAVVEESTPSPDPISSGSGIGQVAAKAVIDVFDQCLKEVRVSLARQGLINSENLSLDSKELSIEKRWLQQRVAELDLLARRLRLIFEHSLQRRIVSDDDESIIDLVFDFFMLNTSQRRT